MKWILSLLLLANLAYAKMDDSIDIFFPKSLKFLLHSQTDYSVFWWNFVVIEPQLNTASKADFEKAQKLCQSLKQLVGQEIDRMLCGEDLSGFALTLKQWAGDQRFRSPPPKAWAIKEDIESALAEISFLSSMNEDLFDLKRTDPTDQWQNYLQRNQALASSSLKRVQGFLVDELSGRIVIPVQFRLRPKMVNVQKTFEVLGDSSVVLVGAHASAYVNEKQVHQDMEIVSIVGGLVLFAFIAFLVLKGRISALLLFPPVAISLVLSAWIVQLIFGSIHGLTLAFGSGIVGLAIDYGLHGAFNAGSRQTWKSNSIGFLTTLTGLVVMIMSGIPLIRQMMIFASLGLFFGFLFFYILCRYFPKFFTMESISIPLWTFKRSHWLVIILIGIGFLSLFKTNLSFDLRKLNYQSTHESEVSNWFFSQGGRKENFLLIRSESDFSEDIQKESVWAQSQGIPYTGLGQFWPGPRAAQETNSHLWNQECAQFPSQLTQDEQKVFSPFLSSVCDPSKAFLAYHDFKTRLYTQHLVSPNGFISILTATDEKQAVKIKEQFPQAQSLLQSVKGFSDSLESDLQWMIPVVFLVSTFILFLYYRSSISVFTAYVPFLTGLGLFFLVNWLKGSELDLISVLGLVMVFGFSLDYGVFATDIYRFPQPGEDRKAVYSALSLAAMTNVIGFFPMVFAQHPVLHQLGTALFFGTIGTYLGTIWGIEKIYFWRKKG